MILCLPLLEFSFSRTLWAPTLDSRGSHVPPLTPTCSLLVPLLVPFGSRWLPFGSLLASVGSSWFLLGSLWQTFGSLWVSFPRWFPFGSLLAPLIWLPLAPFWLRLVSHALFWLFGAPFCLPLAYLASFWLFLGYAGIM